MEKICIQCGKSFELTESEVAFFEGKGLEVPKRCSSCRKANKKNRNNRRYNGKGGKQKQGNSHRYSKSPEGKTGSGASFGAPTNDPLGKDSYTAEHKEPKKGFFARLLSAIGFGGR